MLDVYQMLLATYAALDQPMSDIAIKTVAADLAQYDEQAIGQALTRCRNECRRITLADIIERIPGGHPGPQEAWAIVSKTINNEMISVAWTEQMAAAYGVAYNLPDDPIAGRMAFIESYQRFVSEARANGRPPHWVASLGFDSSTRETATTEAKSKNLLIERNVKRLPNNRGNLLT